MNIKTPTGSKPSAKKKNKVFASLALFLSTLNYQPSTLFAQGSLTPPGAPAPTMKTLDQIEARTPISSAPITINTAGSYYLTKNLSVSTGTAITIATNGVTLDLNGFTISSTAGSATGNGILLSTGLRNIVIRNGFIQSGVTYSGGTYSGSGFDSGINYTGTAPVNALASHVSVTGVLNHGITLGSGNSTIAEACTVQTGGGYGIVAAVVRDCAAIQWGITAIFANEVSNSRGVSTGGFDGISATTAQNCYGQSNSGDGIGTDSAINCYGISTSGSGIYAHRSASGCYAKTTSGFFGLLTIVAENCYGENGNGVGLNADTASNCKGISTGGGQGVSATTANNCYGTSNTGTGLNAEQTASNCYGVSSSGGTGISAGYAVSNCSGVSNTGFGISTSGSVNNSYGKTSGSNGAAVSANWSLIGCYGDNPAGFGLQGFIAAFSYSNSPNTLSVGHRYFCGSGPQVYP
jgi:hypothetical protein